ncbi:hypothetical protein CVT25_015292 [Psilocybe cyanescens]|uniref:Uncharacterized protein n=1 Tax=Psilocybe cyanescens TaxID=93625 RepID=A0A409XRF8_PSICY|nr:hypothetical protein CVT25_015292 [Psilocybe cyanescens]
MTGGKTMKSPTFHTTLKAFTDAGTNISIITIDMHKNTDEFATTSTNCPGTKCIADKVVP